MASPYWICIDQLEWEYNLFIPNQSMLNYVGRLSFDLINSQWILLHLVLFFFLLFLCMQHTIHNQSLHLFSPSLPTTQQQTHSRWNRSISHVNKISFENKLVHQYLKTKNTKQNNRRRNLFFFCVNTSCTLIIISLSLFCTPQFHRSI